jgi:hypothetical protein
VGERVEDDQPANPLGVRQGVAEGEGAAERFAKQRDRTLGRRLHRAMQVGHQFVHHPHLVAQAHRRHRIAPLKQRDLPVEQQTGAVDARHQDQWLFVWHSPPLW